MYWEVYACRGTKISITSKHNYTATCLGRGDTNLRTGVDVDTAVGLTRDRGADRVDDTDTERATLQAVAQREDRVGRLAALADEHADVVAEDGRLAVEEVGRELDRDRDLRKLLEDRARRDRRVVARAARAEHDTTATADDVEVRAKASERDAVLVEVDTATHGVDDRLGLLVDLLLHEVVKLALHDLREFDLKCLDRAVLSLRSASLLVTAESVDVELALSDVRNVIVLKVQDALRVLDDRGRI